MANPVPFARMWGAVMTDDGPIAEVRDVATREEYDALRGSDTFRVWGMAALSFPVSTEDHSRGKPCVPGAPCRKCHTAALTWWWEHGRRTKKRSYTPVHAVAKDYRGFNMAHYGKERDTLESALDDARAFGFAYVVVMDGHGHRLEWIEVSRD